MFLGRRAGRDLLNKECLGFKSGADGGILFLKMRCVGNSEIFDVRAVNL